MVRVGLYVKKKKRTGILIDFDDFELIVWGTEQKQREKGKRRAHNCTVRNWAYECQALKKGEKKKEEEGLGRGGLSTAQVSSRIRKRKKGWGVFRSKNGR